MKIQLLLSALTLALFIQCKKADTEKSKNQKIEKISAVNNYDFGGSTKFEFYSDSTYVFTTIEESTDHEKTEKFSGFCYSKKDTLYFDRAGFRFNESEKAVIKNNFIEFIDGKFPLKIEIKKNLLQTKNKLALKKYEDYAFFTFDSKFYSPYFDYKPNTIKPYDLTENEFHEVDQILKKCFSENNVKLRKIDQYVKQCIVILNDKNEKEVLILCYCKSPHNNKEFKYSLIQMNDGGNCNISLKINLTKHNYSALSVSGLA